ncbi:MAG: DUF1080 domain-containing protein [Candidatus Omnitrophica bacterium]|nr:DUF1080 domain-containing protein [Candidatus Omnitrophota bacterium]
MKRLSVLAFVAALACAAQASENMDGWISLFDGKTLNGWKGSENHDSVKVEDGMIFCDGPRSHLFYVGDVGGADFKNFEFSADVKTMPGANSGLYFHTEYQEEGWPEKGYEAQINNTHHGEGDYYEFKKTGSLYGVRNQYLSIVDDQEWFNMRIIVKGRHIEIFVNDMLVVDYVEPPRPERQKRVGRFLSSGTFAIQCHDPESKVYFKNIRVKPLPGDVEDSSRPPVVDDVYKQIAQLNEANFPLIDFHVHLKGGMTLEDAKALSRKYGVNYGIAPNCGLNFPITDDEGIERFLESMKGQPVFIGMQAEGREWVDLFSADAISQFDYVFSDAMTFFDIHGKRTRIWINEEVEIDDPQDFMEMYIDRIEGVINDEPIDIFVNPTFLPEVIADQYDALWTQERMMKVIDAAAKNSVAIEINNRYRLPSPKFIKLAKQAGVKFSCGTNNSDADFGRPEYFLDMVRECKLKNTDMFMPKPDGQKPVQVKDYKGKH